MNERDSNKLLDKHGGSYLHALWDHIGRSYEPKKLTHLVSSIHHTETQKEPVRFFTKTQNDEDPHIFLELTIS